jgi:sugar lactone lactonase YvrE
MSEVEHVLAAQNTLGEGPLWSIEEQALYWLNIYGKTFSRYYPATGKFEEFSVGTEIGVMGFREKGGLIMATRQGFGVWDWDKHSLEILVHPEADKPGNRFNDGAVDALGRFWAGTMDNAETHSEGVLYRLDSDLSVHAMITGMGIPNGLGWSPDNKTMYHVDSSRSRVYAYDFDLDSGAISNKRTLIRVPDGEGFPDGLTIDSEGYIWLAHWAGWRITRYDPNGNPVAMYKTPVSCPTSCAFGGENLDTLYLTSAWKGLKTEVERKAEPLAGDLFRLKTGVKGVPENKFRG